MHEIFKTRYDGWAELEDAINAIPGNLERGDAFEGLAAFYFQYFRLTYQMEGDAHFPRVDKRPFPSELIERLNLGKRDLGIDGLYLRSDDALVAVQVKWRSGRESLAYSELATFWSEAENADYRLVFTNTANISDVADRRHGHLQVSREHLEALDAEFFAALVEFARSATVARPARKAPREYQQRALDDILGGFADHDRGKLIAACGIGKTLIALWAAEFLNAPRVLFAAPNLHLIRQTLNEWSAQSSERFRFIAVCSDQTISSDLDELSNAYGTDIPITTDPTVVAGFLGEQSDDRLIVFSTYQSLNVVATAAEGLSDFMFDLGVFDEAHKTAGLDSETGFGVGLHEESIPIARRLFMTATERLFAPRLQEAARDANRLIFSMENREIYGPTFHRLTFSQAIQEGIISDYRIVVALLTGGELMRILLEHELVIDPEDEERINQVIRTSQILNYTLLKKVVEELHAEKLVSYHGTVNDARVFAEIVNERSEHDDPRISGLTVNGAMPSSQRQRIIETFERAERAILSNARCLIEGVDIPLIDGVFFAAPKNSLVDIVQAVGRALRKPYGVESEKTAYVVIPVITNQPTEEIDVTSSAFDRLFSVVQALRDQDEGVADQIDQLNLALATGGALPPGPSRPRIFRLIVPGLLSVQDLEESLMIRIADVNSRPTGVRFSASTLGQGERGSTRERRLRTMGDYTVAKYRESCVDPTLSRMGEDRAYTRSEIRIDNNNVSHAEKLGVITSAGSSSFVISDVGRLYRDGTSTFEQLFQNQLLLYEDKSEEGLYPYRLVIKFLLKLRSMRYRDFLYGVYSIASGIDEDRALDEAHQRALLVRNLAIRPEIANEASRNEILEQLVETTGIRFDYNDVWTDRTTTYNQFRYFRRHLELFDDVFVDSNNELLLLDEAGSVLEGYLARTEGLLGQEQYGTVWWLDG